VSDRNASEGGGLGWFRAKLKEVKPDLAIIDGLYLMKDDRSGKKDVDWKAMASISRDTKAAARDFGIPVIGVTQANRGSQKSMGEDLTETAYSDAFGQDADLVMKVNKVRNKETGARELVIGIPGGREAELDGFVINGNPCYDFSFVRAWTAADHSPEYGEGGQGGSQGGGKTGPYKPKPQFVKSPVVKVP
jgi:hypothetical protein